MGEVKDRGGAPSTTSLADGADERTRPERVKKPTPVGSRLRQARKALGFTLRDVAEMTGIGHPVIAHFETGHIKNPAFDYVVILARALDIDIRELAELVSSEGGAA